jgi:3-oxoacyl-ACP reductase-like protein
MDNNNYNNPFLADDLEEDKIEAPVVETPSEPVQEPVEEAVEEAVVEPVAEAVEEAPVAESAPAEEPVQSLGFTKTGAIGSMAADGGKKKVKSEVEDLSEKVAIHSTKSVRWEQVGAISKGYNIVTKAQADKWLTRGHVRIATPEEVKKAFG